MKATTWYKPAYLYIIDLNGMTKFGITTDWKGRRRLYLREYKNLPFQEVKKFEFDRRWQAEIVEYMMSRRLQNWILDKRYEWLIELPVQHVLDCYWQIKKVLAQQFQYCEPYHWTGSRRYGYYKQLFDMLRDEFDGEEVST